MFSLTSVLFGGSLQGGRWWEHLKNKSFTWKKKIKKNPAWE